MSESKERSGEVFHPPRAISAGARIKSLEEYYALYERSVADNNDDFWKEMAQKHIDWFEPFTQVQSGGFEKGDVAWFADGKLNVSHNCLDRHLATQPDKVAILWEGDDSKDIRRVTYRQLHEQVCKFANVLKSLGVKTGDTVCIYMPMVPETAVAMLACARIGAPHSVVFAGFSSDSLRDRVLDGHCNIVLTADQGRRGGKLINLKSTVDQALLECPAVRHVVVLEHTGAQVNMVAGRDQLWHSLMAEASSECAAVSVPSEHPLFYLFTSGSTGKPKGIQHSSGGYAVYASMTHQYIFDIKPTDVYACMADVGWITGHTYLLYGPLLNGTTTVMFESTPLYPDASRYWDMVERHQINVFYTAPTAIRSLMKFGEAAVKKHDRSSLRVLGSVGEPINPEAWRWYYDVVGDSKCCISDTYWQTETGGIVISCLPGCTPMKPGAASLPFFGIRPVLVDDQGAVLKGNDVRGNLCIERPWPGVARTCFGDHERYLNTYMRHFKGLYFTGDGASRDNDGYYWVTGRVDDVMSVSGHRIGSAEIESALVLHKSVAEAAVVGIPHDVKGQSLFAYVTLKEGVVADQTLTTELRGMVRQHVGAFASPDEVLITAAMPKTRSGKIMRRLLRKIASNETDSLGDITTLADEGVVELLISQVNALRANK